MQIRGKTTHYQDQIYSYLAQNNFTQNSFILYYINRFDPLWDDIHVGMQSCIDHNLLLRRKYAENLQNSHDKIGIIEAVNCYYL